MVMMTVVRAINHRNGQSGRTRGNKRNRRREIVGQGSGRGGLGFYTINPKS